MDSGDPNSVPYVYMASAALTKQSLEPHSFVSSVFVYTITSQSVSDWQIPWAFGEKKAAVVLSQTLMLHEELLCGLRSPNQRETEGEGGERKRKRERIVSCQIPSNLSPPKTCSLSCPAFAFLECPEASQGTIIYYMSTVLHILHRRAQRREKTAASPAGRLSANISEVNQDLFEASDGGCGLQMALVWVWTFK